MPQFRNSLMAGGITVGHTKIKKKVAPPLSIEDQETKRMQKEDGEQTQQKVKHNFNNQIASAIGNRKGAENPQLH